MAMALPALEEPAAASAPAPAAPCLLAPARGLVPTAAAAASAVDLGRAEVEEAVGKAEGKAEGAEGEEEAASSPSTALPDDSTPSLKSPSSPSFASPSAAGASEAESDEEAADEEGTEAEYEAAEETKMALELKDCHYPCGALTAAEAATIWIDATLPASAWPLLATEEVGKLISEGLGMLIWQGAALGGGLGLCAGMSAAALAFDAAAAAAATATLATGSWGALVK